MNSIDNIVTKELTSPETGVLAPALSLTEDLAKLPKAGIEPKKLETILLSPIDFFFKYKIYNKFVYIPIATISLF